MSIQSGTRLLAFRFGIAGLQALGLIVLTECAVSRRDFLATYPDVFNALLLTVLSVPIIAILGLGRLPARALRAWVVLIGIATLALGYYISARRGFVSDDELIPFDFNFSLAFLAALFISNVLATDSILACRFIPDYRLHFDTAWKQAIQLILASLFTVLFWGVLLLGAVLFSLLKIEFFLDLLRYDVFYEPATALAVAASLHLTDVQPAIIRGTRGLTLTLFSWLLPLLAFILAGFLLTLPFISLARLWGTHFAGSMLLTAALLLVFLINCAYQDGWVETGRSNVRKIAQLAGAVELLPITVLAVIALHLRVSQYGWTVERIFAAAGIVLFASYALGYLLAVIRFPASLKLVEVTNIAAAYVYLVLFAALFSPVADPARLMVASQIGRLDTVRFQRRISTSERC